MYDLETAACVGGCVNKAKQLRAVPVLFLHKGSALLGGSTSGTVKMWNVKSRHVHQVFALGSA